eukprot:16540-Heterococcus_DN1.PRE.2
MSQAGSFLLKRLSTFLRELIPSLGAKGWRDERFFADRAALCRNGSVMRCSWWSFSRSSLPCAKGRTGQFTYLNARNQKEIANRFRTGPRHHGISQAHHKILNLQLALSSRP